MVVTCVLGGLAVLPAFGALGALIPVLHQDFGWTRTQITTANAILTITTIFLFPATGRAIDRWGARRPLLLGLGLLPIGYVLLGLSGPQIWTWIAAWVFTAVVGQMAQPPVWAAGLVSRFTKARGLALGVAGCGVAVGYSLIPVFTVSMTERFGWRSVYFGLAALTAFVLLPLAFALFYDASDLSRTPKKARSIAPIADLDGLTMREALRSIRYWQLVGILVLTGGSVGFLFVHLQPILRGMGLSALQSAR